NNITDLIRYDLTQLSQLAHPRILQVVHPLEDTKELMAFASEAVRGNLDQLVIEEGVSKLEMKLGVLQIIDGLSYLHNSAKILHGNLTPAAVYVTNARLWKIGSFSFSVGAKDGTREYACFPWTKKLPSGLQPDLDFLAPEYLAPNQQSVTTAADVFSLGVLICWVYAGGKRIIDAKNNLESHAIICGQLDEALGLIADELGQNLKESLSKVLSMDVDVRPSVQLLALIKHFDDPAVSALRQLDDIAQEFDPTLKAHFLSQTLFTALPNIPEPLWFSRILSRFNEQLLESPEIYASVAKPLLFMLEHCESHNIHKLKAWIRTVLEHVTQKTLASFLLENMAVLFRRMSDEQVEDKLMDLVTSSMKSEDPSMQSSAIRGIPTVAEFLPMSFVIRKLLPVIQTLPGYLHDNVPRQLDLLAALAALSDRCDPVALQQLTTCVSLCSAHHPVIIHAKSRLVQRVVTRDGSRLRDPAHVCFHLLNPLVVGLASRELSPAHFDDVMSSIRILLDIVEQLRYDSDNRIAQESAGMGRLSNRRVSMSSNNLPRVMITAARPSLTGDNSDLRKMSFLSADGRLEDRGRRESKDSRGSIESDVSIRIGNGSDVSDDSSYHSQKGRRQSWLDSYGHSCSLEQTESARMFDRSASMRRSARAASDRRARTRSPTGDVLGDRPPSSRSIHQPARPNSFTNLGHNLVLTYRNFWQKD
ncbi:hypothetical protein PFISCL1PPCAC_18396, partial [Pristionchus fissidentatus]